MKHPGTVLRSGFKKRLLVGIIVFIVIVTASVFLLSNRCLSRNVTPLMRKSIQQSQKLVSIERKLDDIKRFQSAQTITNSTCQPTKNVAFAKTHKTGSSTLQNILLRYGIKNDLNFAFPGDSWMFSIIEPFNASLVLDGPFKDLELNMFVSHSMWRQKEVEKILPKSKTKYITLLRDPVDCFESNYVFMGAQDSYKMDVNEFAKKFAAKGMKRERNSYFGQNNLLWDLGMDIDDMADWHKVKTKIEEVEQDFDLVLIAEKFDESLLLLQTELCWSLEDILYVNQLERVKSKKTTITPESREILQKWLWADYLLYDHFVGLLNEKIKGFGQDKMETKVKELKNLNQKIYGDCVLKKADKSELTGEASKGVKGVYGLEVNKENPWCFPFLRRETEFAKMIRDYQKKKVKWLSFIRGSDQ